MIEKSKIDANKERNEEETLDHVILLSRSKKKLTRDILSFMKGETIKRQKNDRPDIVRKIFVESQKTEDLLIGVEHFRVEQGSVTKNGRRISLVEKNKSYMQKMAVEKEQYSNDSEQYQNCIDQFVSTGFNIAAHMNMTGVFERKESFHLALEKHLLKASDYRNNMNQLSNGKPSKLAFLIEIRCIAGEIFLNNGRTVKRRIHNIFPVFDWMMEELEQIEPGILDYVVLYIRKPFADENEDVVAIEMKDIRGSLRKQGIIIYHYCNTSTEININNLGYSDNRIKYSINIKNQSSYLINLLPGLQAAYELRKDNIPFVATRDIQELLYACGKRFNPKKPLESIYQPETLLKFDEFTKRYPIEPSFVFNDT